MSTNPPVDRKIDTETIQRRLLAARQDGLPRGERDALEVDATAMIKRELRAMVGEYGKAVMPGYDAEMLVRDACTAVSLTEGLWEAAPETIFGAVMTAGQLGLRIGVLGHSWILPFWSPKDQIVKAQLIIGYQGYIDMCYGSGLVVDMATEIVYDKERENGNFRFWRTEDRPHLFHEPDLNISSRTSCPECNETNPQCNNRENHGEKICAFYATARTKGGGFSVTRPWSLGMMLEHRKLYAKTGRTGQRSKFWFHDFPAAGRKTMARQLTQLLPKNRTTANALYADEGVRSIVSPGRCARIEPAEQTIHEDASGIIDVESAAEDLAENSLHPADR